jgi:formylglycine-generating enzyme required for sulfatase activity
MKAFRMAALLLILFSLAWAEEFEVKSFELIGNDLTARVHEKKDINEIPCAVLKIRTDITGPFLIETNLGVTGNVEYKTGELVVYISENERQIRIAREGFIKMTYDIPLRPERWNTYQMVLTRKDNSLPVVINSIPADAEKYIDGKLLGTDKLYNVERGTHTLLLKKAGYKNLERQITVSEENKYLENLKMTELELAAVQIRSTPQGATVLIDGVDKGKTDVGHWYYPGSYELKLNLTGYLPITEKITVREGQTNTFSKTLTKNIAYLTLSVNPADATITIQGKNYAPGEIELIPGHYTVQISRSGYLSQSLEISLELGQRLSRSITLVKNAGTLVVTVSPTDAVLLINKENMGSQRRIELAPGRYRLELEKTGWNGISEMIEIELGATLNKSYTLIQKVGKLQFSVTPLDAAVSLKHSDGSVNKSWSGMQMLKDLPIGEYTLTASMNGYESKTQKLIIEENKSASVTMTLDKKAAAPVAATPTVADPSADGRSASGIEMLFIKGGSFDMGSNDGENDEKPVHRVTVSDFYMGKTEITVAQFAEFIAAANYKTSAESGGGSYIWTGSQWEKRSGVSWKDDVNGKSRPRSDYNHPVIHVSWLDAAEYCNWLSRKEGRSPAYSINGSNVSWNQNANGYRLPTEAEWEYAAGTSTSLSNRMKWAGTSNENSLGNYAWYSSNSGSKTHPVGTKQPNALGLHDMSGNVWEWCWDWYGSYSSNAQTNPAGPPSGSRRVIRGGGWFHDAQGCRVANRFGRPPSDSSTTLGFRLVYSSK